jgi:hypothetical protein
MLIATLGYNIYLLYKKYYDLTINKDIPKQL